LGVFLGRLSEKRATVVGLHMVVAGVFVAVIVLILSEV
jgi:hypothetical protein